MKLLDIRVTDGPNYWSIRRHQLVVMSLDLEEMEERPTGTIPGFYERITTWIPSLCEHHCSEGEPGGFFRRVQAGTWMGHVIEHIALEIQTLAGMNTGFGRTRDAGRKGLYHVVFSCEDAEAGIYAGQAAIRIATALANDTPYDLAADICTLKTIGNKNKLGPSTAAIVEEAKKRNIPVLRLNDNSLLQLGYGAAQRRIEAALASTTSNIAVELASDKEETKRLLTGAGIPVPPGETVRDETMLKAAINRIGYPLVIKPLNGNHGRGVTMDIQNEAGAHKAFQLAQSHSEEVKVICERFITGSDFRVLVVNYTFIAAALRTPAAVTGNGVNTIRELVEQINQDPQRGECHENLLTKITIDTATIDLLHRHQLTADTVLPKGRELYLKATANLSTGGTATDVTDTLHPANIALCERVARTIGLDICGIDIIAPDLSRPLFDNGGVVIEVNAGPGLRMHLQPSTGQPRNVAAPIIDMLFPNGANGRIPIIGITGTNGKTTTTRLIAHIGKKAGYRVGFTTTDGIYIDDQLVMKGDCTGPFSSRLVLKDPAVNLAVLECARGGILRGGLGFDHCDIAVITNIGEDHLGLQGINSIEQLARLKSVLAETVSPAGYAVLNADDPNVYNLKDNLSCRIALFSMSAESPAIRQHVRQGGVAAVYDNGFLTLIKDGTMIRIGLADKIPVTFSGLAQFNITNALAASLAAWLKGIDVADIYSALLEFIPTPESIPGRMNIFDFGSFRIIADYAHNTHGLQAIGDFLRSMPASIRIGVIAGVGDRRDQDIISLGAEAARIFDEIIIRHDADLRGRHAEEFNDLLCQGIRQVDPAKKITIIPEEGKSVTSLLERAQPGMVATIFTDDTPAVIAQLQQALASVRLLHSPQLKQPDSLSHIPAGQHFIRQSSFITC
jgi:cyanophycin synthetase